MNPHDSASARTTADVLASHLGAFARGLDAILADYADDACLITPERVYRGRAEIGDFFWAFLDTATPAFWEAFRLQASVTEGDVAYITWASPPAVPLATDTLLVRHGRIAVQTFTPFSALGG